MYARKALVRTTRLGIQDEVDVTLFVEQYILGECLATATKPICSNSWPIAVGSGASEFDEFEAVGAHRVVPSLKLRCHLLLLNHELRVVVQNPRFWR